MPDPTPHKPTPETRAQVSAMFSFGITQTDISKYLGICVDTLHKYYRKELDTAVTKANAAVANRLYKKAIEGNELQAQIFWLKSRARWRTRDDEQDHTHRLNALHAELEELRAKLAEKSKKDY